jgi:hypothetical protein
MCEAQNKQNTKKQGHMTSLKVYYCSMTESKDIEMDKMPMDRKV